MRASIFYWLTFVSGMAVTTAVTFYFNKWWIQWIGLAVTMSLCITIVTRHKQSDQITFRNTRAWKFLQTQVKWWIIFNLLTFPFIALFYVPYNIFWLQYTPIQLLKWFLTAGLMGSFFNLFYRPYVSWVTHLIDKRKNKKQEENK